MVYANSIDLYSILLSVVDIFLSLIACVYLEFCEIIRLFFSTEKLNECIVSPLVKRYRLTKLIIYLKYLTNSFSAVLIIALTVSRTWRGRFLCYA